MTRSDVSKILAVMEATYPTFKINDMVSTINAWHWALQDYSYESIDTALKIYIKTDSSNFAPSVSKLISLIDVTEQYGLPTEAEAWAMVRKGIESLDWADPAKTYDSLPEVIQIAVVNPANLREWACMDTSEVETVISSNFMRTYRTAVKRYLDIKKMPEPVKLRIEKLHQETMARLGGYTQPIGRIAITD